MKNYQFLLTELLEQLILESEENIRNNPSDRFSYEFSLYDVKTHSDLVKEVPVENTYLLKRKRLIPVIVSDIIGDFANLRETKILEGSMVFQMLIPTDKNDINNTMIEETFQGVSETIYDMINNNLGKALPLGTKQYWVGEDYEITFYANEPVLVEELSMKFTYIDGDGDILVGDEMNSFGFSISDGILILKPFDTVLGVLTDGEEYELRIEKNVNNAKIFLNGEEIHEEIDAYSTISDVNDYKFSNFIGKLNYITLNADIYDILDYEGALGEDWDVTLENVETLTTVGSCGIATLDFTLPNPIGNQFTMGEGLNYQTFLMDIAFSVSDNVFMGNQVRHFIDDVEVYPFTRNHGLGSEADSDHKVNESTSKGVITSNSMLKQFTLHYKPEKKIIDLIKHITDPDIYQNKVFKLKEIYPFFKREYNILIQDGGAEPLWNSPLTYSIEVILADDVLLEEE